MELRRAFIDIESLINSQGEVINDIARQVAETQDHTKGAVVRLEQTVALRQACRKRWCIGFIILVILVVVLVFVIWSKY